MKLVTFRDISSESVMRAHEAQSFGVASILRAPKSFERTVINHVIGNYALLGIVRSHQVEPTLYLESGCVDYKSMEEDLFVQGLEPHQLQAELVVQLAHNVVRSDFRQDLMPGIHIPVDAPERVRGYYQADLICAEALRHLPGAA